MFENYRYFFPRYFLLILSSCLIDLIIFGGNWFINFPYLVISQVLSSQPIYVRGSLNKFPDFFRTGTFIDSTHMKL